LAAALGVSHQAVYAAATRGGAHGRSVRRCVATIAVIAKVCRPRPACRLDVVVGSTWPGVFVGWRDLLAVLFVVPAFYVSYLWLKQL